MANKRVLVCSIPCWNSKTGSDTLSSLMEGYDTGKIANLYTKEGFPDSKVCDNYFRISENAVIRSLIKRKTKTGTHIILSENAVDNNSANAAATDARYKKVSSGTKRNYLLLLARELIWKFGRWKTPELDKFIEEFNPDTVFFPMEGYIYFNRINRYILKKTGAKGVGYFWDDNFTYKQSDNFGHNLYRFFQRISLKKTAKQCSDFFAITPKTKEEADDFFNINCKVLTKPCNFEGYSFSPYSPSEPLRMLYTGKLIIGRFETIKLIGDALDIINADGEKIFLDIYTTTVLSEEQKSSLSKYVHILGAIPQNLVAEKQANADILLFAEAVDGENSKTARLSFSTKITDYLRSGKCIFAVGKKDIAPMEYLKNENAAIVAESLEEITSGLESLINDKESICIYAKNAFECGKKNHNKSDIQELLFKVLNT